MSLVTSCPACYTRFKIVPDQLKVSEGWVRCGQCSEIFDASTRLEPQTPTTVPASRLPVLTEAATAVAPANDPVTSSKSPVREENASTTMEIPGDSSVPEIDPLSSDILTVVPSGWQDHPEVWTGASNANLTSVAAGESEPEFVRKAKRQQFWSHPWVTTLLIVLILCAGAALGVQVLHHERDRLAATQPRLAPVLTTVCAWLDCQTSPYKDPEATVIDATRFTKLGTTSSQDVYQLEVTLKNRTDHPVATPSLELTLTSLQDDVVIRRVFTPKEMGLKAQLEPETENPSRLSLKLAPGMQGKVSGYRLTLFY